MPFESHTPSPNIPSGSPDPNHPKTNLPSNNITNSPQIPQAKIQLLISTRNPHKIHEIASIIGPSFSLLNLSILPNPPLINETGHTFLENATLKALEISKLWPSWVIADDSGLVVDALNGEPGIISARFAGQNATDQQNCDFLLKRLANLQQRAARFICVIALAKNGKLISSFEGILEGTIATSKKGSSGFGYDPLFIPAGHQLTLAEMPQEFKNQISHRRLALEKLKRWPGFFAHDS